MVQKISVMLISIMTVFIMILAFCSPRMQPMLQHCPDAHINRVSIMQQENSFSCFSFHVKGIQLFNQVVLPAELFLFFVSIAGIFFVVRIVNIALWQYIQSFFIIDDDPLFVLRKQYRWLAQHNGLY